MRFLIGLGIGYVVGKAITELRHSRVFVMKRQDLGNGLAQDSFLSVNDAWSDASHAIPISIIKANILLPQLRASAPTNTSYQILTQQDIVQNALTHGNTTP